MFELPFYHELIKKTVIGFGALFSQVKVLRPNPNNINATAQVVAVPIAFGPKEKTLARVDQDPSLTGHTYITLPRMAFEVTGYNYDSSRMVSRNNKIQCYKDNVVTAVYTPVPYNIEFSLYILTKGTEDGLGIIEQILPTFTPEYTLTVNALPELNIIQDIPIILNSVSVSDDYEGDFATRRLVTHTLNFTAKINLFGNISTGGVILRTDADIKKFQNHTAVMDADGNIIVDVWNPVSRESLDLTLSGSVIASSTAEIFSNISSEASVVISTFAEANLDITPEPTSILVSANVTGETAVLANIIVITIEEFVFQNSGFNYAVDGFADTTYPTLTVVRGQTYYFNLTNVFSSHPLALRLSSGDISEVPGTTGNNPAGGVFGNGTIPTTVIYQVPLDAPASIVYQCVFHSGMIGLINIIN